ncbi:MAG: glycosyltransferase family 39 protein [Burkholderiales bacterium]
MNRAPPHIRRRTWGTRRVLALSLVLLAALWFGTLEYRDLFAPDEGRYAEIPREMVASGDWVTPRLNDLKYFEKPALQYWVTAAAYRFLGESEWTARLWPATTGFLGLLAVLITGGALFGRRAGIVAGLLLASMFAYPIFAGVLTLDMGLAFFATAALFCFLLSQQSRIAESERRRWMLAAWAAMGLAVLSKGLIGAVLPALALVIYVAVQRDASPLRRLWLLPGLALFLLVAAPWFAAVQMRNPEFFGFFFIHEHFARFALPDHNRPGGWYYYIPVLLVAALPWTPLALGALRAAWKRPLGSAHLIHVDRALLIWCATVFVFFSLSRSKLPAYILPILPALALLAARHLGGSGGMRMKTALAAPLAAGAALCVLALYWLVTRGGAPAGHYAPWILAAGSAMMLGAALARQLAARSRPLIALCAAAVSTCLACQLLLVGAQSFAGSYSSEALVDAAQARIGKFDATVPFYSVQMYDQTLPLHVHRFVTLVDYQGELALGIAAEPNKVLPDLERFRSVWRASGHAYAIMPVQRYEAELPLGLPMCLLARDRTAVIVARAGRACLAPGAGER